MILVLARGPFFGGVLSVIVVLMAAPAVVVDAAPSSAVHSFWAAVLAVTSFFVISVQRQISFAKDSVKFMTKAIM